MTRCKGCQQPIKWITTKPNNKAAPCDPDPVPVDGEKMLVFADGTVGKSHTEFTHGFISHFATCPKSSDFKKGK